MSIFICPVCTIAVASGVELSRWLGVDDTISGIWIGGLVVSLSLWLILWLKKKNISFQGRSVLVFILFYGATLLTFYLMKMIGTESCQKLWGYDKLLVGMVFGSLGFAAGHGLNLWLKKNNQGKVYFPFQKVVLPILFLVILSVIFYFVTKC